MIAIQFDKFQQLLPNVTDPVLTSYFHAINTNFSKQQNQPYPSNITRLLMEKMYTVNQFDTTMTDYGRFNVTTAIELKNLCADIFKNQIIYQLDNPMVAKIEDYLKPLGIKLERLLGNRAIYWFAPHTQIGIYVVIDKDWVKSQNLKRQLNWQIFGGDNTLNSIDNFLNTI